MIIIFIKGLIYGALSIIPGLSGGALAIKFGDYDKCINILNKKDFSISNLHYLVIIIFGFILGTNIFSNIILGLYLNNIYFFKIIIFIINIYLIVKLKNNVNKKLQMKIFLIALIIFLLFRNVDLSLDINNYLLYGLCGIIFSFSKIVPGVSATSLFINLNFYDVLLKFFSNPIRSIINCPYLWLMFILLSIIEAILMVKIIYKYYESFNHVVISVLIYNTLDLII